MTEALQKGCTRRAACAYANIGKTEFYEWLKEDADFADTVTRAEDQAEAGFTMVLQNAAAIGGDWRAAESWLKRRRRDEWSERLEQTGANGGPMKIEITAEELTDDELAGIATGD